MTAIATGMKASQRTIPRKRIAAAFAGNNGSIAAYANFPFVIVKSVLPSHIGTHSHEYFEIDIVLSGSGHVVNGGKRYELGVNDIMLGNQFDTHAIVSRRRISLLSIKFGPALFGTEHAAPLLAAFVAPGVDFRRRVPLDADEKRSIRTIAELLLGEYTAKRKQWQQTVTPLFEAILSILRRGFETHLAERNITVDTGHFPLVYRIMTYLDEHYCEELRMRDIVKRFGGSSSYAASLFTRIIGHSLKRYVIVKRVLAAKRLLTNTDDPISDICFAVGFGDMSNFNRAFKTIAGTSPREYRSSYRT